MQMQHPTLCTLRIKEATARSTTKTLSAEEEMQLAAYKGTIAEMYRVLDDLVLVLNAVLGQEDPKLELHLLDEILGQTAHIQATAQKTDTDLDAFMLEIGITSKDQPPEDMLALHYSEAKTAIEKIRLHCKLGNHWGRDILARLSKKKEDDLMHLTLIYGKEAVHLTGKLAEARQVGESLYAKLVHTGNASDVADLHRRLHLHLNHVEELILGLVENVVAAGTCEVLEAVVYDSEASIRQSIAAIDAKLQGTGETWQPDAQVNKRNIILEKFKTAGNLMQAGRMAIKLRQMARQVQITRERTELEHASFQGDPYWLLKRKARRVREPAK